ncbi:DUF6912 family protein [Streptomyces alkaliterrae]|uniref:Uncharacterized protein n=1 Tax=Streptomyces alkaliterrae TaxID=2213162 RepID=A0A5P0YMK4_9ACTN|nr:hypothetical protein [Streptomyces alkaliterrae]MBB1261948.1 hypothetical protein [Streptomyces alkaliterrae]MQS00642.1 hypothetical protein [Streptomyces alkaliterrae]
MRVYLPLTLPGLAAAHQEGEVGPAPLTAYAVTPGLRAWSGSDDLEELEYAALGRAARASLRLLAADQDAARRRVVLAADVADRDVRPDGQDGQDGQDGGEGGSGGERGEGDERLGEVRLARPLPLSRVAAVHVDAEDAAEAVQAAARALAGPGGAEGKDAAGTLAEAEDHELLWYATQELENLL